MVVHLTKNVLAFFLTRLIKRRYIDHGKATNILFLGQKEGPISMMIR